MQHEMTVQHKTADEAAEKIIQQDFNQQKQELAQDLMEQRLALKESAQNPDELFKAQQDAEKAQATLEN